jgi:hypothetical protein
VEYSSLLGGCYCWCRTATLSNVYLTSVEDCSSLRKKQSRQLNCCWNGAISSLVGNIISRWMPQNMDPSINGSGMSIPSYSKRSEHQSLVLTATKVEVSQQAAFMRFQYLILARTTACSIVSLPRSSPAGSNHRDKTTESPTQHLDG